MRIAFALALIVCACTAPADESVPRDHVYTAADREARLALERGLEKVNAGDAGGAIADLTRAIELDPTLSMAFNWRGHCLNLLGAPEEALADYDRAIALDPDYAWSHYARGMANHNLGRYEAAIAGYTRSIELDPAFVKAWHWRGFTRKLAGDYAGSASDLEQGLVLEPDDAWALAELAKARQAQGDHRGCRSALERIVALDGANGSAHAQLGFLAAVEGDRTRSIAELERACALNASEQTYARIWIWMQREEHGPAVLELREWFDGARIDDPWELRLTAFVLGEGTDEALFTFAKAETASRVARGAPKDFLICEAAFYAGLRAEVRGDTAAAVEQYSRARAENAPEAWEWSMAAARARSSAR